MNFCLDELKTLTKMITDGKDMMDKDGNQKIIMTNLQKLQEIQQPLINLQSWLKNAIKKDQRVQTFQDKVRGFVLSGNELSNLIKEATKNQSDHQTKLFGEQNPYDNGLDQSNVNKIIEVLKSALIDMQGKITIGIDSVLEMISFINDFKINPNISKFYRVYVSEVKDEISTSADIHLMCLSASVAFKRLQNLGVRNILLTSGTLSPLDSFSIELGIPFEVKLQNDHVINVKENLLAMILKKGPFDQTLNFSYKSGQNNDEQYIVDLGESIANICRQIPKGILVFFSSYALMEKCYQNWATNSYQTLQRIENSKVVLKEPKQQKLLAQKVEQYKNECNNKQGAVMLAVCRGKISEGIDFPDDLARGVILVGIPFPPIHDRKIELKKSHLEQILSDPTMPGPKLRGSEWYTQQAIRAMNQSAGRVIRHINDWGIIIFADERFQWQSNQSQISKWIRNELQIQPNFQSAFKPLVEFCQKKKRNALIVTTNPSQMLQNQNTQNLDNNQMQSQDKQIYQKKQLKMETSNVLLNQSNKIEDQIHENNKLQEDSLLNEIQKSNNYEIDDKFFLSKTSLNLIQNNDSNNLCSNNSQSIECIVCLRNDQTVKLMKSKCGHIACQGCWDQWLNQKLECPICRQRVRKNQIQDLNST